MGAVIMLLDESRRVIEEVARRCFFKGKHSHYLDCLVWEAGEAKNLADKENNHAGSY
jgi:hypothetical protein